MGKINVCLKRTFTVFNALFATIGAVIILFTLTIQLLSSGNAEELTGRANALLYLYIIGGVTLVLGVLGAHGANKENKVCLIIFLVCMVLGSLLMLLSGVPAAAIRPTLDARMEQGFRRILPLDKASPDVKEAADMVQTHMQCCGLFSYKDWEDQIPESCLCSPEQELDQCQTVSGYSNVYARLLGQREEEKSVYAQTCYPILRYYVLLFVDIAIGTYLTLAALALLGMILSSIMIHQLREPPKPVFMAVPSIFTGAPPKYQELQNPPCY